MPKKRRHLAAVPIPPKPPLTPPSPAVRRPYTGKHQIEHLIEASDAEPDRGFMTPLIALCSLPRTNPGDRLQYRRANGPYSLVMTAGTGKKLPYGNLPRLLLAWITTEAVRTQSPNLMLGASLADFMRALDVYSTSGGATGGRTRLRNQMDRLFGAAVSLTYADQHRTTVVNSFIADEVHLWWNPKDPELPVLWESTIELGQKFFAEITRHPVPLNLNILKALKRSSLGLDIYLWLTYRTFTLQAPLRLTWAQLYRQFGANPTITPAPYQVRNFRHDYLRELAKIKLAWPDLRYQTPYGVLLLFPSMPVIRPV